MIKSPIDNRDCPLTWEQDASEADYDGLNILNPAYVSQRNSAQYLWQAAEVFLHLLSSEIQ